MKLTAAEQKWITDIKELLRNAPSDRIGFYTIGDCDVMMYDHRKEERIDRLMQTNDRMDFPHAVRECGANIDDWLAFPNHVHSVAG